MLRISENLSNYMHFFFVMFYPVFVMLAAGFNNEIYIFSDFTSLSADFRNFIFRF